MGFLVSGELNRGIYTLQSADYNGLAGVETATGYWGLSSFPIDYMILLYSINDYGEEGYETHFGSFNILGVPNVNKENVVYLSEHFRVTDPEQTVIDMIRYKRHEFHLYETLISAIDSEQVDVDRLNNLAKQYNVYDRMYKLLDEALIAEEEDANQ